MKPGSDMIGSGEAAEILGLTRRRVRQVADQMGAVVVSGVLLFPRGRVEEYARTPRPGPGWRKGRPRPKPQP